MSAYVFTCNKSCITNTSLAGVIIIFLNTYIRRKIGGIKCLQKKRIAYRKKRLAYRKKRLAYRKKRLAYRKKRLAYRKNALPTKTCCSQPFYYILCFTAL
jgi:hypothetical protein